MSEIKINLTFIPTILFQAFLTVGKKSIYNLFKSDATRAVSNIIYYIIILNFKIVNRNMNIIPSFDFN